MRTSTRRWTESPVGLPGKRPKSRGLPRPLLTGFATGWVASARKRRLWALEATLLAGGFAIAVAAAQRATPASAATEPSADVGTVALAATPKPLEGSLGEDALVELGRRLFFDPGASHSKRVACASCHDPAHGYSDSAVLSADDFGQTLRHSQPLLGLGLETGFHWDGEFASIEDLVSARTGATRSRFGGYRGEGPENLIQVTPVADSLAATGLYARAFEAAFGDPKPTRERLSMALAWYVRSLRPTPSPFDRYAAGDASAMSAEAVRGLELFRGRAGCAQCHTAEGERPAFTDRAFHNTGIARSPTVNSRRGRVPFPGGDDGRGKFTKRDADARSFKTPSLRDVALRAPYMHDGSFSTLESVVRYYALECGSSGDDRMDARLKPFAQGRPAPEVDRDVDDLVAFLVSLTGETRAGIAPSAWSRRAEKMRLRFVQKDGKPYRGAVAFYPGGDVLPAAKGASSDSSPMHVTPDAEGWVEVSPRATTHLAVAIPGANLRPATGDLVPDTCHEGVLTLEPDTGNAMGGGSFRPRIR